MKKREIKWPGLGTVYDEAELRAVIDIIRECIEKREAIDVRYVGAEFEKKFASMVGAKEAVFVNSCGTALDVASLILELGPNTFICTATTVLLRGATVRFADIDPVTWNIDPRSIESRITERTKAIYPVHYAGLSCDMDSILKLARKHHLAVVEDAAHALGATYKGRPVGGIGDMTCFSFQTLKNITTLGEGGMLTTNNEEYARAARQIRSFGFDYTRTPPTAVRLGMNLRMTKLQAAVGLTQLDKLERQNARRREIAEGYNEAFAGVEGIQTPVIPKEDDHPVHLDTVFFDHGKTGVSRSEFRKTLKEEFGVETRTNYEAVYDHEVMRKMGYDGSDTPVADRICRGVVNLPIHPSYSDEDTEYIVWAVKEALTAIRSRA
jgi:perosamine synthetase